MEEGKLRLDQTEHEPEEENALDDDETEEKIREEIRREEQKRFQETLNAEVDKAREFFQAQLNETLKDLKSENKQLKTKITRIKEEKKIKKLFEDKLNLNSVIKQMKLKIHYIETVNQDPSFVRKNGCYVCRKMEEQGILDILRSFHKPLNLPPRKVIIDECKADWVDRIHKKPPYSWVMTERGKNYYRGFSNRVYKYPALEMWIWLEGKPRSKGTAGYGNNPIYKRVVGFGSYKLNKEGKVIGIDFDIIDVLVSFFRELARRKEKAKLGRVKLHKKDKGFENDPIMDKLSGK